MLPFITVTKTPKCNILILIRTATKKAAGSRTSMKDSAGRRLGPKKYDGQKVKPGEIIMRQRGTKIYPGEYVGIGKDHTLFSLEYGFVRYYLDPFHPRKKFVGVSLSEETKLPRPHFEPTPRRFGHLLLDNKKAALKEESSLSRKQFLAQDEILEGHKQRTSRREILVNAIKDVLREKVNTSNINGIISASYLLRLGALLKNGFSLKDAQFYSREYLKLEAILQSRCNEWKQDQLAFQKESIEKTCALLDETVSFDNKFNLIGFISPKEKEKLRKSLYEAFSNDPQSAVEEIQDSGVANLSTFLSLREENTFKRRLSSIQASKTTRLGP